MEHSILKADRKQAGFTLVELAIVMIIIGLLIGGILKGQELIANAQVAASVSQLKGIDAAVSTFRDTYNAFPGDMNNADTRLVNCSAAPCVNGDGNGRITQDIKTAPATDERMYFWGQLNAADLFAGAGGSATPAWGDAYPAANVGGGYHVGFATGATSEWPALSGGDAPRSGHYLALHGSATEAPGAGNAVLGAKSAARIDRKMDDGSPTSGTVRGGSAGQGNECSITVGASGSTSMAYDEQQNTPGCLLYVRIQQ